MSALQRFSGLTESQAEFVCRVADGTSISALQRDLGFSNAYKWLRRPAVLAAIREETQRRLVADHGPAALGVLRKLLDDEQTPVRTRAEIGVRLASMAGYAAREGGKDQYSKPLSEMTPDEMRALIDANQAEIDKLEAELASQAKQVSAPDTGPDASKLPEMLD